MILINSQVTHCQLFRHFSLLQGNQKKESDMLEN